MSRRKKSPATAVEALASKAYLAQLDMLEGFAGRPASEAETALLTLDAEGRYPQQPLSCAKVRQFVRELDVRHAWAVEGLLRVSAPTYAVRALWAFIGSPDFSLVRVENVHVISSALKLYLREQRQLVIYRSLFPQLVACMRAASVAEQQSGLRYVVSLMDPMRRLILRDICRACGKILLFSASNRMDRDNIAVCLSPSVIETDAVDPMEVAQAAPLCRAAFALLLADADYYFDAAQLARDDEQEGGTDSEEIGGAATFQWVRLTEEEWATLLGSASVTTFRQGEYVCREEQRGALVYRVHSGSCSASRSGRRGASDLLALDVFGLELSLGARHYRTSVVTTAVGGTVVYQLPVSSLYTAFAIEPSLAFRWYCTAAVALALQRTRLLNAAEDAAAGVIWSARDETLSNPSTPNGASAASSGRHSSTATFALKRYNAKWHSPDRKKPVTGVVALTCTHLAFERGGGKQGAFFVGFAAVTRVSVTETAKRVLVAHATESVFDLEDEAAARELRDALLRVLACQAELKLEEEKGGQQEAPPLQGLCTAAYSGENFHLELQECDVVTLIKDDPKEHLWYGECGGKEGYFGRDSVVLMPELVEQSQRLSGGELELLASMSQRIEFGHGELMCREKDLSCVGFLYIVLEGVCVQTPANGDGEPLYLSKDDVFGELGVLLGTPIADPIAVFSDKATLMQLDCRRGSALSELFRENVALASRVFRFVAAVCAARVELLQEHLRRKALANTVVRDRLPVSAPSSARKNEFDESLVVLSVPDSGNSSVEGGSDSLPKAKTRRRQSTHKKAAKKNSAAMPPNPLHLALTKNLSDAGESDVFNMLTAKGEAREDEKQE